MVIHPGETVIHGSSWPAQRPLLTIQRRVREVIVRSFHTEILFGFQFEIILRNQVHVTLLSNLTPDISMKVSMPAWCPMPI